MTLRPILRWIVGLVIAALVGVGGLLGSYGYINWSAEKRANEFCAGIPVSSDISSTIAKADAEKIPYGKGERYAFIFSGFIFDKALCYVSVNSEGKITSREAEMRDD